MPTIIERNGRFLARVRKDGFKPVSQTFHRKSDALAWGRKVEADMQAGRWAETSASTAPTLREALRQYRAAVADQLKGAEFYAYTWDQLCALPLADKPINEVSAPDLAVWRDSMAARGLAAGTVARRMGLVSGFLSWCVKDRGLLPANLMQNVRKPKVTDGRDRLLSVEERAYLLDAAKSSRADWLADALVVLLQSAMRRGELFSLTAGAVDFAASTAHLTDTKNGSARHVPLCPDALAALQRLALAAASRAAAARAEGQAAPARGDEPLLPLARAHALTLAFRRTVARAQRQYAEDCARTMAAPAAGFLADLRVHDLRHTAATHWAEAGLSVLELSAVTGHKTLSQLKRYTHLSAQRLAQRLAKVQPERMSG